MCVISKKYLVVGILASISVPSIAGAADTAEVYNNTLHVVNVTAQRSKVLDVNTPASTTVISNEDMQNMGAKNAFDAVNFIPGITSYSYGPSGLEFGLSESRVSMRGLDRGALVLVNGAPYNLTGRSGLSSIPTAAIKKIEVLKGAASALYGAEALGGVINVITKTPEEEGGVANIAWGNHQNKSYDISYGNDKFLVGVKKEYIGAQNQTTPIRTILPKDKRTYEYYNNRDKSDILGIYMSAKINDNLTFNYTRSEVDSAFGQISTQSNPTLKAKNSTTYKYEDNKNTASFIYEKDELSGILFYNDREVNGFSRKHNTSTWQQAVSDFKARQYGLDLQNEWDFRNGRDYLIGGVLLKRETYKATSGPIEANPGRNSYALYGSYSYEFTPKWTTILGARYTKINDPVKDQSVFIPNWQLLYKETADSSWYVNVGKAFTMPNLNDTFKNIDKRYTAVSGKNLKPEEGWNYEFGYKRINKSDGWKVAIYHMDFKNFFAWKPDVDGKMTVRVNGGKFRNTGIEAEYTKRFTERLQVSWGISYSNPEKKEINSTQWVQASPKLQLTSALSYESSSWEAGTAVNFLTKRLKNRDGETNPNLVEWNAYIGYKFNENQSLRLDVYNILDRHNVISDGDWEYWDEPFNYRLSYKQRF